MKYKWLKSTIAEHLNNDLGIGWRTGSGDQWMVFGSVLIME